MGRLPLAILFALTVGRTRWSLAVLVAAGASDMLDGWLARRLGQATDAGAVIDAVMDKVFVVIVVVSLVVTQTLSPLQCALLGTRELGQLVMLALVLLGRFRTAGSARHPDVFGKLTTLMQYVTVAAAVLGSRDVTLAALTTAALGGLAAASYALAERSAEVP